MLTLRQSYFYLTPVLIGIAGVSLFSSILFQIQLGERVDIYHVFDISFYYFIPVFLWLVYLPFIYILSNRFPLTSEFWRGNLKKHILISLAFAPVSRLLAITLDFWIKSQIGMIEVSVLSLVAEVRWTIIASIPKGLFTYWTVLLLMAYFQKGEIKKPHKLILESSAGANIIAFEDILWIEAAGNYIMIHTVKGKVKSRKTFKALLGQLDQKFIQIHRSKIVNQEAVSELRHWRNGEYLITMKDGKYLSSTRTYLDNVRLLSA